MRIERARSDMLGFGQFRSREFFGLSLQSAHELAAERITHASLNGGRNPSTYNSVSPGGLCGGDKAGIDGGSRWQSMPNVG